ncbi:MAG: PEP-CTERM sorting domain-containing protein [Pseudomonadota bacterium]
MNAAKTLIATLFIAAASLASVAHATVINFNNLGGTAIAGNTGVYRGYTGFNSQATFTDSGFKFVGTQYQYSYVMGAGYNNSDASNIAYNGNDFYMSNGLFTISSAVAAPFSVNSLDLARWNSYYVGTSFTATLVGNKVGGGTVTSLIDLGTGLNSAKLTGNDFGTYALTGFNNLSSLTVTHNFGDYLAMDNLVVNATNVPEPSSIALFGLAVAAGAFARRRAGKAS